MDIIKNVDIYAWVALFYTFEPYNLLYGVGRKLPVINVKIADYILMRKSRNVQLIRYLHISRWYQKLLPDGAMDDIIIRYHFPVTQHNANLAAVDFG